MAVIVQRVVGAAHDSRFYPDFSGVARSYNFYPFPPQKPHDGIVSVALGLGRTIVEGGATLRFCPRYPRHILQLSSPREALRSSQRRFFALDLNGQATQVTGSEDLLLRSHELQVAEADGVLQYVGSTYSPENEAITDGLSRTGPRVVTFAPILRSRIFPLPKIMELLLDLGAWGMGTPVELEFAVRLSVPESQRKEFALLQIRPLVLSRDTGEVELEEPDPASVLCRSTSVMGNGVRKDLCDVVMVDIQRFERTHSAATAEEVARWNRRLVEEQRQYLLVGVGRWGSLDPWLGIPVRWDQISGAAAIVEAGFKDLDVTPSQGSHFFQNITSFMVGYFTVTSDPAGGLLDWDWLLRQPAAEQGSFTRLLRLDGPLTVRIDGRHNRGMILKPGTEA